MSIKIMTRVWQDKGLKGSDRLILLALADNANDEGVCWPSLKTIAAKVNLSVMRVTTGLKTLEVAGYIERQRRAKNGASLSTVYTLLVSNWDIAAEGVIKMGLEGGYKDGFITPIKTSLEGVINTGLDEPSLEPSINLAPKNGAGDVALELGFEEKVSIPTPRRTADEYRRSLANSMAEGQRDYLTSGRTDFSWLQEHLRPLAQEFITCAGNQYVPTKTERSKWRKIIQEWQDIGITAVEVRLAVDYMRDKGLTIGGPESVTKIARDKIGAGESQSQVIPKFRANI